MSSLEKLKEEIWLSFIETFPHYESVTPDFASIRFEEEEIAGWKEEHQHNLTSIWDFDGWNTVENAKKVLKDAGYFVDNLWSKADVTDLYCNKDGSEVNADDAHSLLSDVVNGDRIKQEINETIQIVAEEQYNLISKKGQDV